ncbi:hypothetical protein [Amycolatopsis panacis]|uniref:hypothetical protein n=1 Tax=Amycolatopsis panacis TaxID=2340917 RepID=UPI0011C454E0|nr:hypothetical protein [Amycolatopsis panacis]
MVRTRNHAVQVDSGRVEKAAYALAEAAGKDWAFCDRSHYLGLALVTVATYLDLDESPGGES